MSLTYNHVDGKTTLSYSLLEDLEACARKYYLYNVVGAKGNSHAKQSIDFAFGHAVGSGVQAALLGCDLEACYYETIINYTASTGIDLDPRIKKKLVHAMIAVREFYRIANYLRETYEVVEFNFNDSEIIGVEPEFSIEFVKDAVYNGHIDVLMRHKITGIPKVIEIKTTVLQTVHPSVYSNSNQVKGYSLAVKYLQFAGMLATTDKVDVDYYVFKAGKGEWESPLMFSYSNLDVIAYIKDIRTKLEVTKLYAKLDNYPMNGSACNNFFRACEFYNFCHWPEHRFEKEQKFKQSTSNIFKVNHDEFIKFEEWLHEGIIMIAEDTQTFVSESVGQSDFIDFEGEL